MLVVSCGDPRPFYPPWSTFLLITAQGSVHFRVIALLPASCSSLSSQRLFLPCSWAALCCEHILMAFSCYSATPVAVCDQCPFFPPFYRRSVTPSALYHGRTTAILSLAEQWRIAIAISPLFVCFPGPLAYRGLPCFHAKLIPFAVASSALSRSLLSFC